MGSRKPLSTYLKTLRKMQGSDGLAPLIADMRRRYSFAHVAFLVVRHGTSSARYPFFCATYPLEWTRFYIRNDYFEIDPVIAAGHSGFLPIDWSGLDWSSSAARGLFRQAKSQGIGRQGMTLPIRGANGERSLFSVTSNLNRSEWLKLRDGHLGDLHVLSQHLHETVLSVAGLRTAESRRPLARRERECLQLVARGLLSKQIAAALEISESAVRLYLRSARLKLGAATVYQAVARASLLELIQI